MNDKIWSITKMLGGINAAASMLFRCTQCQPGVRPEVEAESTEFNELQHTGQWGTTSMQVFIEKVNKYYDEAMHWQRNCFSIPHGTTVKVLIEELSKLLNFFICKTSLETHALKAFHLLLAFSLQKPSF